MRSFKPKARSLTPEFSASAPADSYQRAVSDGKTLQADTNDVYSAKVDLNGTPAYDLA